jgi:hypothetical protein
MVEEEQDDHAKEEDVLLYLTSMVEDKKDEYAKEEDVLIVPDVHNRGQGGRTC